MQIFINILGVVGAFWFMELVAWFAHKYVMHTFGWGLHEDHHRSNDHFFHKNDLYASIFAIPSWLNMMFGIMAGCDIRLYIGIGILLYGAAYVYIHEAVIHNRWGSRKKVRGWYLQGVARAHFAHHKLDGKTNGRDVGQCFGLLIVPRKFFKIPEEK